MYLTYNEYASMTDIDVDETVYRRAEYKARVLVNMMTFNRLINEQPVRESVKYLMAELITMYTKAANSEEQTGFGTISSMSNDGVSMSFASGNTQDDTIKARATSLIKQYLATERMTDGTLVLSRCVYT